ncbi:hypothetical protein D3C85_1530600 [compost metagenome]
MKSSDPARGVKLQGLALCVGTLATLGSMTRAEPAPAPDPNSDDPLYTVADNGIHLPAR